MISLKCQSTNAEELSWLSRVKESRQPLSESSPIWVRYGTLLPGASLPHPERHPYCEFRIQLEGRGILFVEREKAESVPGDLFLIGSGIPHWSQATKYPYEFITIYFLPSVMIEMGPQSAGPAILRRLTAFRSLNDHLVRPPPALRRKLTERFHEIEAEFGNNWFGREIRLRTLLVEQLVQLLRWEERIGPRPSQAALDVDWQPLTKSLRYLHENYREPIYAQNLARAAGVSESRLKILFHNVLRISWVKYLQGYRIHRAAALLSESRSSVAEAAFAVGFESISHFNVIFRDFMGVPPSEYGKQ